MFAEAFAEANEVGLSETKKASHSEVKRQARNDQYAEHDAPITLDDVRILRSIIEAHNGQRMSINDFTSEDIQKAQKWAYKFYKELNVKSPFFRAWFGDWRAYDNNTDVYFVDTKQDNRGSVVNDYTGWNIQTSKKVHKETSHHSGSPEVTAVKYLPYIDDITKKAVLFDSIISDKENENSLMFHTMYAYTEVLGYPALLKIKVEELFYHNRETSGILKRDYILQNIEEESISKRNRFSRPNHSETNSSNMSISDLFALVKQYDKDFKPKLVHESMIENGKPKVFYHGTNAEFTEFDRKKARYGLYGKVFYFTDSESNAKNYGNTMPVYLDVKAPLEPNKTEVTTAQIKKFLQTVAENEDYDIYNYGTDNVDKVLDMITSRDAFAVIQDINSTAIGDFVEAIKLWNEVNGSSFDGIVTPTETVVFEPEQIKSATYSEDLSGPTDNIGTFDRGQKDIRYSERNTDSSRMLLANALESAATNSAEAARLALYKENIAKYDAKQEELAKVNGELRELYFSKGKRDRARIDKLRARAEKLSVSVSRYDKILLGLESTKQLKDVLEREKSKVAKREKEKSKKAVRKERERFEKKLEEQRAHTAYEPHDLRDDIPLLSQWIKNDRFKPVVFCLQLRKRYF